jgi:hypothetical protein
MKTIRITQILFLSFFLVLASCDKHEEIIPNKQEVKGNSEITNDFSLKSLSSISYCGTPTVVDFIAGQTIKAGLITVSNDQNFVYVTFSTSNDWQIGKTHLYVGSFSSIPVNSNGSPKIGLFPYSTTHQPMVSEYTYKIEISKLSSNFVVAAHAEVHKVVNGSVVQSETAWGNGVKFVKKGTWATYFNYSLQSCCEIVPQNFKIFGGQTILAGNLVVTNDNEYLYVTYNTSGNWYLNAVHLHVGSAQSIPVNSSNVPIPGQFQYSQNFNELKNSYTFKISLSGLPECYAIAAHSELVEVVNGVVISSETGWSDGTNFPNTNRWGWYSSYCTQGCK